MAGSDDDDALRIESVDDEDESAADELLQEGEEQSQRLSNEERRQTEDTLLQGERARQEQQYSINFVPFKQELEKDPTTRVQWVDGQGDELNEENLHNWRKQHAYQQIKVYFNIGQPEQTAITISQRAGTDFLSFSADIAARPGQKAEQKDAERKQNIAKGFAAIAKALRAAKPNCEILRLNEVGPPNLWREAVEAMLKGGFEKVLYGEGDKKHIYTMDADGNLLKDGRPVDAVADEETREANNNQPS